MESYGAILKKAIACLQPGEYDLLIAIDIIALKNLIVNNFAKRKKLNIGFENRVFNLLGKISFEIFLFHPIAIVLGIKLVTTFQIPLCSVYLFGFCFTVLFALLVAKSNGKITNRVIFFRDIIKQPA